MIEQIDLKANDESGIDFEIFTSWFSEAPETSKYKIMFSNAQGDELSASEEYTVEFKAEGFARSGIAINKFAWPDKGRYYFSVALLKGEAWENVARIPVLITIKEPQNIEATPPSQNVQAN
ncbi:MAG TPA: hypothetical protein VFO29_01540 [Candidatus Rubrimentiphilum sp.]|nr:hypothetical protein [Candidatus Rubrimentiphilum sp.]